MKQDFLTSASDKTRVIGTFSWDVAKDFWTFAGDETKGMGQKKKKGGRGIVCSRREEDQ